MELDGKYALITGSSRGIGRGIALALAENRVKVAIHYYQNESAAKETLAQVRQHGSDGVLVQADVTRPEQIAAMVRQVHTAFGKLDLIVSMLALAHTFPPPPAAVRALLTGGKGGRDSGGAHARGDRPGGQDITARVCGS